MNWNTGIRQLHRWLSIAFSTGVIAYIAVMVRQRPPGWVGLFAFVPLAMLLVTGLYLFVLPYAVRLRGGRRASSRKDAPTRQGRRRSM